MTVPQQRRWVARSRPEAALAIESMMPPKDGQDGFRSENSAGTELSFPSEWCAFRKLSLTGYDLWILLPLEHCDCSGAIFTSPFQKTDPRLLAWLRFANVLVLYTTTSWYLMRDSVSCFRIHISMLSCLVLNTSPGTNHSTFNNPSKHNKANSNIYHHFHILFPLYSHQWISLVPIQTHQS